MNKCKMGCQRAVSPGLTRRGNKWSTCCRKCTTTNSESHDHHCIKRNKKYLKKMQQWICSYCTLSLLSEPMDFFTNLWFVFKIFVICVLIIYLDFKHKCKLITCDGETKEINGYNPFLLAIRMYGGEAFTCHYVNHSYDWNKNNIKIYEQALIDDEQVLNGCVYGNYISYGLNLLRAYGSAKDIKRNKKKRKIRNLKRMRKSFNEMEKGKTYYLCLRCEVQG
eukprot:534509_1